MIRLAGRFDKSTEQAVSPLKTSRIAIEQAMACPERYCDPAGAGLSIARLQTYR